MLMYLFLGQAGVIFTGENSAEKKVLIYERVANTGRRKVKSICQLS